MDIQLLKQTFSESFRNNPIVMRSPGRVNLIGEHTDYNEGFVLPAAINKAVYIAIGERDDNELHFVAMDLNKKYIGSLDNVSPTPEHWPDYILGVVDQLQKKGYPLKGFNCVVGGEIPQGAGMSSSAALECATLTALNELFHLNIDKISIVKMAQRAENDFVGVKCGIMDQFASVFGKKDHVIKLDCRSLEYEYYPFDLSGIKIVLLDTAVKHSLASSEYNTRRSQCEQGVAWVKEHHPEVNSLRDVSMEQLKAYVQPKDELIFQRCSYVVGEILRLQQACADLLNGNIAAFGKKMFETHDGLSKLYAVSCKELDFLVDAVKEEKAVLGARMMGGGFGGCTINLIKEEAIEPLTEKLGAKYKAAMQRELKVYVAEIENGSSRIE